MSNYLSVKELMQQYTHAVHKIDQESTLAEQQVIRDFPHDPDGPGLYTTVIVFVSNL